MALSCRRLWRAGSGRGRRLSGDFASCRPRRRLRYFEAGRSVVRKSATTCQGTTAPPPRMSRQRTSAGVTGKPVQGGGAAIGVMSCASAINATTPVRKAGSRCFPARWATIRPTDGAPKSAKGVRAPCRRGFQYLPPRRSAKCTWPQLLAMWPSSSCCSDVLPVLDGGHDVPVAVLRRASALDDRDVLGAFEVDDSGLHRVDGRPVRTGYVDAEVEGLRAFGTDARVAEERPDGVLMIKRLERPAIAHLGVNSASCARAGSPARAQLAGTVSAELLPRPGPSA